MATSPAIDPKPPQVRSTPNTRVLELLFWILLLFFEFFLLTLPLLPNGDGPMHTYLSTVFWKVAMHRSPLYQHYYAIRHLLQPYSLHYYLLIFLEKRFSMDAAEKIVGGLIWATVALGFRTLARALGPGASAASLLVFPLLFSWPFSAGFFNFTLGCGLLLFSLAYYVRLGSGTRAPGYLAAFALTLVLQVLAHPVPLMALICITGLDLCFQLLAGLRRHRTFRLPRTQAIAWALSCIAFLFPLLIADKSTVAGSVHDIYFHLPFLRWLIEGVYVSYFQVHSLIGWTYQVLMVAMLPFAVILLLRAGLYRRFQENAMSAADRLLAASVVFLAASLFFPNSLNGSAVFAVRMWYLVWLIGAACTAALPTGRATQRSIAGFGLGLGLLSLYFAFVYLRPVAREQAAIERAPLPPHARGLLLQPLDSLNGAATHTWWALNFWSGVRAFTTHGDVLLNTPWLQLTILPIRENGRAGLMRDVTPNAYSENAGYLRELNSHPEQKAAALRLADFILIADPGSATPEPLAAAASLLASQAAAWGCTQHGFYAVCVRRAAR